MAVRGIFASDSGEIGGARPDFESALLTSRTVGTAPMLAMSAGLRKETITSTAWLWMENHQRIFRAPVVSLPNGPLGQTLEIEVAASSWITDSMVFMVEETGEYLHVLGVTGNIITVQRGFALTQAVPLNPGPAVTVTLQRIGTAFEEGSERPVAVMFLHGERRNYTQIFRNSWGVTGTTQAVSYDKGGRPEARSRRDAAYLHAEDIERALMWGRLSYGVRNSQPIRTMDGFVPQIRSNILLAPTINGVPGGVTRESLNAFIEVIFSQNIVGQPNERIVFAGSNVLRVLNDLVMMNSEYEISLNETAYGIKVRKFITVFGELTVLDHVMMNLSPIWRNNMYVFHPGGLRIKWLRDTFTDDDDRAGTRQGLDADAGVITSELTCGLQHENVHGAYLNIQNPVATPKLVQIVNNPLIVDDLTP